MPTPIDALYLSPHLDDAVYSCGDLIHHQTQTGQHVLVVTICAGTPPPGPLSPFAQSLHARWGVSAASAVDTRRREDQEALVRLGAAWKHLDLPDCIYRTGPDGEWLYTGKNALFGDLHPADQHHIETLLAQLAGLPGLHHSTTIYAPLAVGNHVDHQLVHQLAIQWATTQPHQRYYEDYPYTHNSTPPLPQPWRYITIPLQEADLQARIDAMTHYRSQRSTFWPNDQALAAAVRQQAAYQANTTTHTGQLPEIAARLWLPE